MTTPAANCSTPDLDTGAGQDLEIDWDEAPLKACPKCAHASPSRYGFSRNDGAEMVRIQCGHCGFKDIEQFWCSMETAVQHWNALPRLSEAADELESGVALKAKDLAERTIAALQAKSAARHKCSSAQQAAEKLRHAEEREPNRLLEMLRATYRERAEELAQEAGECPRSHWGAHLDPHDVKVDQDGLVLTWDINGDYAPACFTATWDALLSTTNTEESAS